MCCNAYSGTNVQAAIRSCFEYVSNVSLGWEGEGSFLSVLPFTLELGLLQPARGNGELFFSFSIQKGFLRKKEWLLKYLGRFC